LKRAYLASCSEQSWISNRLYCSPVIENILDICARNIRQEKPQLSIWGRKYRGFPADPTALLSTREFHGPEDFRGETIL
jgi:hypothetical protein